MNKKTAEQILGRAGKLALLYYPEIDADDPDYSLAGDIQWALEGATAGEMVMLIDLVAQTILDPTGTRDEFTDVLYATVTE